MATLSAQPAPGRGDNGAAGRNRPGARNRPRRGHARGSPDPSANLARDARGGSNAAQARSEHSWGITGWRVLQSIAIRVLGMLRMLVKEAVEWCGTAKAEQDGPRLRRPPRARRSEMSRNDAAAIPRGCRGR